MKTGRQQGQATVELALALPVIVAVLLLVVQVALVVRAHVLVVDAAREGARAAAVGEDDQDVTRAVRAVPGLAPERIEVAIHRGSARTIAVTVRYRVATDVALVGPLVADQDVSATVTMQVEEAAAS